MRTRYAGDWSAVLDRLADPDAIPSKLEEQPEGFPPDRRAAFASYARARASRDAVAGELAEAKTHAEPRPPAAARELRERARAAARWLAVATRWLAAWGITDAQRAWEEAYALTQAWGAVAQAENHPMDHS